MKKGNNTNKYFQYILSGSLLAIVIGCVCTGIVYGQTQQKKKDGPEKLLIGKWKSPEANIEFKTGKKVVINGDQYDFAIIGTTIFVGLGDESMEFPYKLNGDTLNVWVEGRKVVYNRVIVDNDKLPYTPPNATRTEGVLLDLVGKWCYQANVQALGGGRQSDICFTLEANGDYSYYGESSSSNVYGGAGSQSWDYGRWSATSTTLTARSNKGETKTYTLERRNHPKTGDPMLIVDGDAFVTFFQKQPW